MDAVAALLRNDLVTLETLVSFFLDNYYDYYHSCLVLCSNLKILRWLVRIIVMCVGQGNGDVFDYYR